MSLHVKVLTNFLTKHAFLDVTDNDGDTPLDKAGQKEVVEYLKSHSHSSVQPREYFQ